MATGICCDLSIFSPIFQDQSGLKFLHLVSWHWWLCSQDEIDKAQKMLEERVKMMEEGSCLDVIILPLYASLPPELQACDNTIHLVFFLGNSIAIFILPIL